MEIKVFQQKISLSRILMLSVPGILILGGIYYLLIIQRYGRWYHDRVVWSFEDEFTQVSPSLSKDGSNIFAGNNSGSVVSFHFKTGEISNRYNVRATIDTSPMPVGDRLFVGSWEDEETGSGRVYAFQRKSGEQIWSREFDSPGSGLAYKDGNLFVSTRKGELLSLDARSGDIKWSFRLEGDCKNSVHPAVTEEHVFIGDSSGYMYAVNITDGSLEWRTALDTGISHSFCVLENQVVVPAINQLYYLNINNGAIEWVYPENKMPITNAPVVVDSDVVVSGITDEDEGIIVRVDSETGEEIWQYKPGKRSVVSTSYYSSLAVGENNIYVAKPYNYIYAINADTGEKELQITPLHNLLDQQGANTINDLHVVHDSYLSLILNGNLIVVDMGVM